MKGGEGEGKEGGVGWGPAVAFLLGLGLNGECFIFVFLSFLPYNPLRSPVPYVYIARTRVPRMLLLHNGTLGGVVECTSCHSHAKCTAP